METDASVRGGGAGHARAHLPRRAATTTRWSAARACDRARWHEYEVAPRRRARLAVAEGFPPSAFHTYPKDGPLEVVFGSCRVAAPHEPPYSLRKDEDERGREVDSLRTLAERMRDEPRERWPDVLLMIGDQVYADEVSPAHARVPRDAGATRASRRASACVDFEEYTRLYRESWSEPAIRWLLSTLSTAMIFDDHDVHDDWNISQALGRRDARPRLVERAHRRRARRRTGSTSTSATSSRTATPTTSCCSEIKEADDGWPILERVRARAPTSRPSGTRWSYCRDLGRTRVVVIDSRAGRVLEEGRRSMLDDRRVEVGRGALHRRLRPPPGRHLAAVAAGARDALRRGLERGDRGRCLGRGDRAARRAAAPGRRPRALGRLPGVVRAPRASSCAPWLPESAAAPPLPLWCSRATCTTPTCARWRSGAAPGCDPTSSRPSARPIATRSRSGSDRSSGWLRRAVRVRHARRSPPRPGCRSRTFAGEWSATVRGSTTSSPRCAIDGRAIEVRLEKAVPVDETSARLERVLARKLA